MLVMGIPGPTSYGALPGPWATHGPTIVGNATCPQLHVHEPNHNSYLYYTQSLPTDVTFSRENIASGHF